MENSVASQENSSSQPKGTKTPISVGVPYPIETIDEILKVAESLVLRHGTGSIITKEQIAEEVKKSAKGLSLFFSTFVHYGVFTTVHGKGYAIADLLRNYMNPVHVEDERKYMLEMFKRPSLYAKIIEQQNGHVLPTDAKRLGNMLKKDPYNVTDYAAERAAKIFLDNARSLGLLDSHNTFNVLGNQSSAHHKDEGKKEDSKKPERRDNPEAELFELPIPLSGNRKAKLFYPLDNLTKKDIRVIAKALAYIASTVLDETDAEEAEKEIEKEVLGKNGSSAN